MKLFVFFLSLLLLSKSGLSQPDFRDRDSLIFKLILLDSLRSANNDSILGVTLKYDFKNQYPYYSIDSGSLGIGSKFNLQFFKLPRKGTVYICTIDSYSNINYHGSIDLSSKLKDSIFFLPSELDYIEFRRKGSAALIIWYSNKDNINAKNQMERMELTLGTYVKRNNGQVGKKLLLPNMSWQFCESNLGLIFDKERNLFPKEFIIPIIIETKIN